MNQEYEFRNAVIESASLDFGARGCLSMWLQLDYGGEGQGFGGFALYLPKSWRHHQMLSFAGHFIYRTLEIAGVESFDKLVGRTIRAKHNHQNIEAIGHIIKDDWFCPADDFSALKKLKEVEK